MSYKRLMYSNNNSGISDTLVPPGFNERITQNNNPRITEDNNIRITEH